MNEKKTVESFKCSEDFAKKVHGIIGFSENSEKSKSECYIEYFQKLILNKSSPAPDSPNGEQKPQVNKTPEQILYDQYLKDTADFKFPPPSENPEPVAESSLLSPLQWIQEHPCPFRTIVNDKGKFTILCSETDKLPIEACMTRQKRYVHMQRNCRPLKKDKEKPQKKWQDRTQEPKTRPYKRDTDGYYDPFSVGDGYTQY